ncbi:MAG: succinylglutamate desuccinylase/aspartoacylase family protein, partial [Nitrososphaerales archaeon]
MAARTIDEIERGKVYTDLLITARPAGNLTLPIIVIKGAAPGPTLTVVAGIHPTEYAGIEAALRLARGLSPDEVKGRVVILPFVNLAGFNARAPGCRPADLVDVWSAFPGEHGASVTYAVARGLLEKVVR